MQKVTPKIVAERFRAWHGQNAAVYALNYLKLLNKESVGYMSAFYENVVGILNADGTNRKSRRNMQFKNSIAVHDPKWATA